MGIFSTCRGPLMAGQRVWAAVGALPTVGGDPTSARLVGPPLASPARSSPAARSRRAGCHVGRPAGPADPNRDPLGRAAPAPLKGRRHSDQSCGSAVALPRGSHRCKTAENDPGGAATVHPSSVSGTPPVAGLARMLRRRRASVGRTTCSWAVDGADWTRALA